MTNRIVYDMPAAEYHAHPGASKSSCEIIGKQSELHCRVAKLADRKATPSQRLGSAAHLSWLQRSEFERTYQLWPGTRRGKAWDDFSEQHDPEFVLNESEWQTCMDIRDALDRNDLASTMLRAGKVEASVFWDEDGTLCKARPDLFIAHLGILVDVKTTDNACWPSFQRQVLSQHYYRQLAHYARGLDANGIPITEHLLIAVEIKFPHGVQIHRLDPEWIAAGWAEMKPLIKRYGEAERSGKWPGYAEAINTHEAPEWLLRRTNGEEQHDNGRDETDGDGGDPFAECDAGGDQWQQ